MPFTDAPDVLSLVCPGKVPLAMVPAFVPIAQQRQFVIRPPLVGDDKAALGNEILHELLQWLLVAAVGNPQGDMTRYRVFCANDNVLSLLGALLAKIALVHLYSTLKQRRCLRQLCPETGKPSGSRRIADFRLEHGSLDTLTRLPAPEQHKELAGRELHAIEPAAFVTGGAVLPAAGTTPEVFSHVVFP